MLAVPAASYSQPAVSPDTTVDLGGTTVDDEDVVLDASGSVHLLNAFGGDLPGSTDLNAYHAFSGDNHYFSTDTSVELPGSVTVTPAMVALRTAGGYAIAFDGAMLAPGVGVDAVYALPNGDLVLSFDTTALVSGTTYEDEDLALWDGATLSMHTDMSTHGVPNAMDLDGAAPGPGTDIHVSFDTSGVVGGVSFDDEDVLGLDPGTGTWSMIYDGSAAFASLATADVVAVPEPRGRWLYLTATVALAALRRSGRRQRAGGSPQPRR